MSYFSESYIGAVNVGPVSQRAPYGSPYMPGYTLVDFFSSYKFDQGVELGFNVNNVFDEVYTPALSTTFSEGTKCYGSNQVGLHRLRYRPHVLPDREGAILSVFARNVGTR